MEARLRSSETNPEEREARGWRCACGSSNGDAATAIALGQGFKGRVIISIIPTRRSKRTFRFLHAHGLVEDDGDDTRREARSFAWLQQ